MAHEITIKPFHADDTAALQMAFQQNIPTYYDAEEMEAFASYLRELLLNPNQKYFTVRADGKIVGGGGYFVEPAMQVAGINWLFFGEAGRGVGAGKKLIGYLVTAVRNTPGAARLKVATSQKASGFFEKFGFKTTRTEKEFWGPGLDLHEMWIAL